MARRTTAKPTAAEGRKNMAAVTAQNTAVTRAAPGKPWLPGQSGNPGGRKAMDPEVKEAMYANGSLGIMRMQQLLEDEKAWGPKGWIDAKTQVKLAEVAIGRAFGNAILDPREDMKAGLIIEAQQVTLGGMIKQVYEAMKADGDVPELINARRADQVERAEDDDEA